MDGRGPPADGTDDATGGPPPYVEVAVPGTASRRGRERHQPPGQYPVAPRLVPRGPLFAVPRGVHRRLAGVSAMCEPDWLASETPEPLLEFVGERAGDRKLRLFACGCARRAWRLLGDVRSRAAVEAAEAFADNEHLDI